MRNGAEELIIVSTHFVSSMIGIERKKRFNQTDPELNYP